jgi:hypothetical protein
MRTWICHSPFLHYVLIWAAKQAQNLAFAGWSGITIARCWASAMVSERGIAPIFYTFQLTFRDTFCPDNHPTAVYIFAFLPLDAEAADQRIQPYLLSVVLMSSAITMAAWKPVPADRQTRSSSSHLAIITSQGQSIHLWSYQEGRTHTQLVEAIPIPIGKSRDDTHEACYITDSISFLHLQTTSKPSTLPFHPTGQRH